MENTTLKIYDIYLHYPVGHLLALIERPDEDSPAAVIFEATLKEVILEEDPTTSLLHCIPAFHTYSAARSITARFVYVNFGIYKNLKDLVSATVFLEGTITIAKYSRIAYSLK